MTPHPQGRGYWGLWGRRKGVDDARREGLPDPGGVGDGGGGALRGAGRRRHRRARPLLRGAFRGDTPGHLRLPGPAGVGRPGGVAAGLPLLERRARLSHAREQLRPGARARWARADPAANVCRVCGEHGAIRRPPSTRPACGPSLPASHGRASIWSCWGWARMGTRRHSSRAAWRCKSGTTGWPR